MPRKMVSVRHCFDMWPQNSCINNFCFDHRVQEYIKSGSDKVVVDPDPDKIYTKRKNRLSKLPTNRSPESPAPKYPSNGWGNSLERMPPFTRAEMNQDIESSRKRVRNADHHSIPTNLKKAKTFLKDEHLKDNEANSEQRYFYPRAKCQHSFSKRDAPHSLRFALCIISGQVLYAVPVKLGKWVTATMFLL